MKKVITILTIAIVMVSAVFATPSATAQEANGDAYLTIQTIITEVAPSFRVSVKEGATAAENNLGYQNVSASATVAGADISVLSDTVAAALAGGTADATVVFSINQISNARTNANYKLTITAGDLELKVYSDGTNKSGTLASNEVFTASTKTLAIGSATASIKGAVLTTVEMASVSVDDSTDILTVDYHGVVAATASSSKELGTYSVTWSKNADAVSGTYEATIKLTVEAQ